MSMDFAVIESDDGPYALEVRYWPDSAELQICPEFRRDWRLGLGEFLRGLGITLDDCRKALEEGA